METIQLLSNKVITEPDSDGKLYATIYNVSADDIVPQFRAVELLQAIADHQDLSVIADWVTKQLEDK